MIQETDKRILDALRCAISGTTVTWGEDLGEAEWEALYGAAAKHNILPLVADALPCELPESYAKRMEQEILGQAERTAELCLLLEDLYSRGLRPLVIKGAICRALYPQPEHRPSTDEDLMIEPASFLQLHSALLDYGLEPVKPDSDLRESYEVSYRDPERRLFVEVHKALFTRELPYLNRMNACFRTAFGRVETQIVGGIPVRTLGVNDHLLYLILHALKHFLLSGVGIRQICDIALYSVQNRGRISWGGLRRELSELGAL
ncbi:MAG: nucleotidyltransferase family protein, partial [Oscillospiraceae bacterium]|nr:nucleotidyltransferase family protein [Oscillospiraceae bacterium]